MNKNQQMWENAFEKINEKYITETADCAPDGTVSDNAAPDLRGTVRKSHGGNIFFALAAVAAVLGCIVGVNHFLGKGDEISVEPAGTTADAYKTDKTLPVVTTVPDVQVTTTVTEKQTGEITTTATQVPDDVYEPAINNWLTMDDVARLVKKGDNLRMSDFAGYDYSDNYFELEYPINEEYCVILSAIDGDKPLCASLVFRTSGVEIYHSFYNGDAEKHLTQKFGYDFSEITRAMTVGDVAALIQTGRMLSWSDFEPFEGRAVKDYGYGYIYDISDEYRLSVMGEPNTQPEYVSFIHDMGDFEQYYDFYGNDLKVFLAENFGYQFDNMVVTTAEEETPADLSVEYELKNGVLTIAEGTTEIYENNFRGNEQIREVRLPDSVKIISDYAFGESISLEKINIPEGVEYIGECAFWMTAVEEVTLPDSLKKIDSWAFAGCPFLKTVNISENSGLESIGDYAFGECNLLESVNLPDSVIYTGVLAFDDHIRVTYKGKTYSGEDTALYNHINYGEADAPELVLGDVVDKPEAVTTYFGYDEWRDGYHEGIDYGWEGCHGSNIYAAADGTVVTVQNDFEAAGTTSVGNYVIIDHGNGYQTVYCHCNDIYVKEGQTVGKSDVIAAIGNTGWVTGPSLHFELLKDGVNVDPSPYFGNEQVTVVESE